MCLIRVGLPFAHSVHGVVAHALSTWQSLLTGFADARQRDSQEKRNGEERKRMERLLGSPCSPLGFFPRLPSADNQL